MNIQGTIKEIGTTEEFGTNGFTKRNLIVDNGEQYTDAFCVEFHKDKCSLLDNLSVGQSVNVSINLKSREYNGRYFTSLIGWKIE